MRIHGGMLELSRQILRTQRFMIIVRTYVITNTIHCPITAEQDLTRHLRIAWLSGILTTGGQDQHSRKEKYDALFHTILDKPGNHDVALENVNSS